ncbi:MAG: dienelactone hydrolase family protein [Antricoccus sp.]
MAEVVLFHHALGVTAGIEHFADMLRRAHHIVHTPDLFGGRRFDSIAQGMSFIEETGFENLIDGGVHAAEQLSPDVVYAGFSFGAMPAQKLAQTRAGARGALLFYSCAPTAFFGPWPVGLPVQIHGADADPYFVGEGDLEAARELVEQTESAELFLYPGDQHLFADNSLPSYDPAAATLLMKRVLDFLAER